LLKLDASYNEVWSKVFDTKYQGYGMDAFKLSSGGYYLTRHQRIFNKNFNLMAIKTDENGNY